MARRNAYLASVQAGIAASRHIHTQMCMDAAMIAANEVFNMGPTRCKDFADAFSEALCSIAETTVEDAKSDKQLWYTKQKLDERIRQICGDHFLPWEERYK